MKNAVEVKQMAEVISFEEAKEKLKNKRNEMTSIESQKVEREVLAIVEIAARILDLIQGGR